MSVSDADIAFAMDLFRDLGNLSKRKMFGGLGIYFDGAIFALVDGDGRLFLKATNDIASELQDMGADQFHNMPYWSVPDEMLDDPEAACQTARRSIMSRG